MQGTLRNIHSRWRPSSSMPSSRGFTLIELLVVLGLIALIVSILLVAMGSVRSSTRRVESANALRQMVAAYDAYSTDHNKRLMPGYVSAAQTKSLDIIPLRPNRQPHDAMDSRSYVWRLAPYLGNEWETMFVDYGSKSLMAQLAKDFDRGAFGPGTLIDASQQLPIASIPSFGLNSIFLGGDSVHGGQLVTDQSPWNTLGNTPLAATRYSEVKVPAQMIVFAPTKQVNNAFNPTMQFPDVFFGSVEVRPPFITLTSGGIWDDKQWDLLGDGSDINPVGDVSQGMGVPISRWGNAALPVGNLDGSVTNETLTSLSNDMRRWAPSATGHFISN